MVTTVGQCAQTRVACFSKVRPTSAVLSGGLLSRPPSLEQSERLDYSLSYLLILL